MKNGCLLLGVYLHLCASSGAAVIIPDLFASSDTNNFSVATPAKLTDNSGLSANVDAGASLSDAMAVTHLFNGGFQESWTTNATTPDYFGGATPNPAPEMIWDLGSVHEVDNVILWQYQNNGGGSDRVGNHSRTIEFTLGLTPAPSGTPITVTLNPVFQANPVNVAQVFSLGGQQARYIRMRFVDNHFGQPGINAGGDRIGLGELRFDGIQVPEPSSTVFLLLSTGLLIRRSRSARVSED